MDATDRAILAQLERDGRISNAELADRVGLTPAPCLRRVRRLEADGVITGYRATVDPVAAERGFEVFAHIEIRQHGRENILAFEREVVKFDEVREVRRMFGLPDYIVRVATRDLEAYEAFTIDRLEALPAVVRVDSRLTMKLLKDER